MKPEDHAELADLRAQLKAHCTAGDGDSALAIFNSKRYHKLALAEAIAKTDKLKTVSPRLALAFAFSAKAALAEFSHIERARRRSLETRLAALESRPTVKYVGTWATGAQYDEGNFVTDHGSVWHARRATSDRPGTSADWQLAVKRGAPAK